MADQVERYWRVCATGLCFSSFGLGGLLMRVLLFPLLRLVVWQRQRRTDLARQVIHWALRAFVGLMHGLGVMSSEIRGAEKLRRHGLLIVANHPSLIDVVLLMSLVERADCIVKAALSRNVFTRGPVRGAGYICNDSGAGLIEDAIASVRAGNNLIIFPEGTRSQQNGPMRLQRGAANVAVRGAINLTPVRIRCSSAFLSKGAKWYLVPTRRVHFVIEVGDDLPVQPFIDACATEPLATRRLTEHLAAYFSPETSRASS